MPVTSFGGLFGGSKWDETTGNKEKQGEKDKQIEKEEAENTRKQARFCGCLLGPLLTIKLGIF